MEIEKWEAQRDQWEATHQHLEQQLLIAREAQAQLDEQKQENMLLKETIDRMRFDMDELRSKADGNLAPGASGSGSTSNQNTISKSLGVELLRSGGKWMDEEQSEDEESSTAVDEDGSAGGSGTEDEDVVQTIITRRKKVSLFLEFIHSFCNSRI